MATDEIKRALFSQSAVHPVAAQAQGAFAGTNVHSVCRNGTVIFHNLYKSKLHMILIRVNSHTLVILRGTITTLCGHITLRRRNFMC